MSRVGLVVLSGRCGTRLTHPRCFQTSGTIERGSRYLRAAFWYPIGTTDMRGKR
jgi:hypothetical protein